MNEYICVVKKSNGDVLKNYKVRAENETALALKIKEEKNYLISYKLKEVQKDIVGGAKITLTTKDLAVFCRQLSSMLVAGVSLVKALNILYMQVEKKNIKKSIRMIYESVQKGEQFSEGIRKQGAVYPEMMISMIEAGEASGKLDHVMLKLADQFEKDVKLKAKIQSAMVGEMRDLETMSTAVSAAETGHFVLSTVHTVTASQTIDRIVDAFPTYQQRQIKTQLASILQGVICQQLIPTADGTGVVPAFEVLLVNDAVRSMIREGKQHQIDTILQTSARQGMVPMDFSLARLVREGKISLDEARARCVDREIFERYLKS